MAKKKGGEKEKPTSRDIAPLKDACQRRKRKGGNVAFSLTEKKKLTGVQKLNHFW